jgi:hypothetical protein
VMHSTAKYTSPFNVPCVRSRASACVTIAVRSESRLASTADAGPGKCRSA